MNIDELAQKLKSYGNMKRGPEKKAQESFPLLAVAQKLKAFAEKDKKIGFLHAEHLRLSQQIATQAAQLTAARAALERLHKIADELWPVKELGLFQGDLAAMETIARCALATLCQQDLSVLETCRDHWKIAFEHERENVIRLREIVFKFHADDCICEDCQLVRQYEGGQQPPQGASSGKGWQNA